MKVGTLQLDRSTLEDAARRSDLDVVVLFGSQARGTAGPHSDVDLALLGNGDPQQGIRSILACFTQSVDVVWLPHASWLLGWEVARDGVLLYESRPGLLEQYRITAALRRADCGAMWAARDKHFVDRFLQGDWCINKELIGRKLSRMVQYLKELEPILPQNQAQFVDQPTLHHTGERLLELIVECAASINTEVAQVVAGIPASDYYSSFFSMARTGWIDHPTAQVLADTARIRNRLVHQYEDVQLPDLYTTLRTTLPAWRAYVAAVQSRLTS